ncbi:hypothetical protein CB0940_10071 [Cercospora beticola]|uniref:Uncharacterized protein n=1 Tax=Cercospora beticola TaxID=122368 RepID=A0A2G5HVW1_CERBT|nr:hypothetical protein CB0940_10071 [Cercospora beticola]PIA96382.1 hypothetical protein CB0940_10071 [Cercospora beticola]WPB06772.1 hypothetical protein RHO25_011432 [Cercospora beticola]CAK1366681.1 unnamed protein product [Cercospora beticola]
MSAISSLPRGVSDTLKTILNTTAAALDHYTAVVISATWFFICSLFFRWSRTPTVSKMTAPDRAQGKHLPDFRAMTCKEKARNQQHQNGRVELVWATGKADTGQATLDRMRPVQILLKVIIVVAAGYFLAVRFGSHLLQYTLYVVTDIRIIAYFCILAVVFTWLRDRGLVRDPCWCYGI